MISPEGEAKFDIQTFECLFVRGFSKKDVRRLKEFLSKHKKTSWRRGMTTKRDTHYGTVDILDKDAFDPKNVKVRITTFVDEDVLIHLKEYAKKRGAKYQTVLNSLLRSFFDKPQKGKKVQGLSEERVRRIVQEELKRRA